MRVVGGKRYKTGVGKGVKEAEPFGREGMGRKITV